MLLDLERFLHDTFQDVDITHNGFRVVCILHGGSRGSLVFDYNGSWYCHNCKRHGSTVWDFLVARDGMLDSYVWEEYDGLEFLCLQESAQLEAISLLYPYTADGIDDVDTLANTPFYDAKVMEAEREAQYKCEVAEVERYVNGSYLPPGLHTKWTGEVNAAQAYMFSRGFSARVLQEQLVYTWDKTAKTAYPLMFILFYQDKVLGYQLRGIRQGLKHKYLTMNGLQKQDWLYGGVPDGKHVIVLTEGLTDRIKTIQYGYRYVFATLGSWLSEAQADLLEKHASHVICAYHDDVSGNKGYNSVATQMAVRQIRTTQLVLPAKDICIAGEDLFWHGMERAFEDLGVGERSYV